MNYYYILKDIISKILYLIREFRHDISKEPNDDLRILYKVHTIRCMNEGNC